MSKIRSTVTVPVCDASMTHSLVTQRLSSNENPETTSAFFAFSHNSILAQPTMKTSQAVKTLLVCATILASTQAFGTQYPIPSMKKNQSKTAMASSADGEEEKIKVCGSVGLDCRERTNLANTTFLRYKHGIHCGCSS